MNKYLELDPKASDLTMVRIVRQEVVYTNVALIPPGLYLVLEPATGAE